MSEQLGAPSTASGRGTARRAVSATPTSRRRRHRRAARRRPGRQPDRGQGPDPVGPGGRGRGRQAARLGRPAETSRPLVAEIATLRVELARAGPRPRRAVRHGRLVAGARGDLRDRRRRARRARLLRPRPGPRRAARTGSTETVVVVSSKSGGTVETDSQRRAYEKAFTDAGHRPRRAASSSSPTRARRWRSRPREPGYRVFLADPDVGGRYSALTAFGLVPSGLAGADIARLLDEAEAVRPPLEGDSATTPACGSAPLLGGADPPGATSSCWSTTARGIAGFGDWAEQLVAESTGKDGKGILPVVVDGPRRPELRAGTADDVLVAPSARRRRSDAVPAGLGAPRRRVDGAARRADAAVGVRHRGRRPAARRSTRSTSPTSRAPRRPPAAMLDGAAPPPTAGVRRRPGRGHARRRLAARRRRHGPDARRRAAGPARRRARLPRRPWPTSTGTADAALRGGRAAPLARRTGRPVTFGWGPRFLHSTGQYHKGGPADRRLPAGHRRARGRPAGARPAVHVRRVPSTAQAAGDGTVLADHGRPVLRLHLTDRRRRATLAAGRCGVSAARRDGVRRTRCATRRTGGCRGSPGRAAWCSSASPATCPARS